MLRELAALLDGGETLFRVFEHRGDLLARYAGKPLQELIDGGA